MFNFNILSLGLKSMTGKAVLCVLSFSPIMSSCSGNDSVVSDIPEDMEKVSRQSEGQSSELIEDEGYTDAPPVKGKEIIFEDDFVNSTGIPDPEKWVLCEKTASNWARYLSESYSHAYTKEGSLYLVGERENGEYQTGGIETRGKFDFQYGEVQCRARFVRIPKGGHTGIWMMPSPPAQQWPKSGEIDIMEHLNKDDIIYETVHSWYADDMGHKNDPTAQMTVEINKEDWNIYGVEWSAEKITYTVNGRPYLEYPNLQLEGEDGEFQWPFNHPFYLILSQSLGGEDTWAGPIDDAELPAIFEIDWIRVLQTKEEASVPAITAD